MQLQTRPPQDPKTHTPEEYLALEETSETRNEYRNGQIIPMAGGTPAHNRITGNIYKHLDDLDGDLDVFFADMRLWIPVTQTYTYPDVMVISDGLQLLSGRNDTVINPCLIVEVLSDSTRAYDRDEKFRSYRSIPSFCDYLLVEQDTIHVEHFAKTNTGQWLLTDYDDLSASIPLGSIASELPLTTIYRKLAIAAQSS